LLPGEYELARRLGIGRSTVRGALAQLENEGLIITRNGHRARILHRRRKPAGPSRSVCLIAPCSRESSYADAATMSEIHAQLAENRIGWEEIFDRALNGEKPERQLQRLAKDHPSACWLLLRSTAPIQRWFAQARLPTLVMGSCHPGVELPSLDMDYRAVGWHAAGRMIQIGHRRLAFILPEPTFGGDIACQGGFMDYVRRSGGSASAVKITAGTSHAAYLFKLQRLLAGPSRPTAILSILPENTLALLFHLLKSKFDVPGDISLVASVDADKLLNSGIPELTRYCMPPAKASGQAIRIIQRLLGGIRVAPKPTLIEPSYVAGATLARPVGLGP
jgi:DNA-binding LacI/PurR family transcriptional regulator